MTDFTGVRAVSKSLQAILTQAITASTDPQLTGVAIDLRSPRELHDAGEQAVSLWLFMVRRDADVFNVPPPSSGPAQPSRPIPLELGYLVTPVVTDAEKRQVLLGRVVETFNDATPVRGAALKDSLAGTDSRLHLHLDSGELVDPVRMWDALNLSYELSVAYLVEHVLIDSTLPPVQSPRVIETDTTYAQVVGAGVGP